MIFSSPAKVFSVVKKIKLKLLLNNELPLSSSHLAHRQIYFPFKVTLGTCLSVARMMNVRSNQSGGNEIFNEVLIKGTSWSALVACSTLFVYTSSNPLEKTAKWRRMYLEEEIYALNFR